MTGIFHRKNDLFCVFTKLVKDKKIFEIRTYLEEKVEKAQGDLVEFWQAKNVKQLIPKMFFFMFFLTYPLAKDFFFRILAWLAWPPRF